ncbi:MAG: tRNA (adenosine(37)-N6)-threonylcarbamoyltransferase complex ATPase subunit type 1 TsaE [Spirochaetaceae bacterium]|jgi:tRNA threonylcarbamoyladenosine biosynthesis protein TsaE|nr:tRNA (adenosine(37)-N6)-threonylcarbamoyltransferase complex ATPase subunit type 1 TsaE [Spirochaetaceae bacterium]
MIWTTRGAFLAEAGGGAALSAGTTVIISSSPGETVRLGKKLGLSLAPGSVIALRGGLGAGKTLFVRGIAKALHIDAEITSPTYTLLAVYDASPEAGSLPLYHFDAYRLSGDDDFIALGAEEYLYGRGVSVIEWSERVTASIPGGAVTVTIGILEGGKRRITISFPALPGGGPDGGA